MAAALGCSVPKFSVLLREWGFSKTFWSYLFGALHLWAIMSGQSEGQRKPGKLTPKFISRFAFSNSLPRNKRNFCFTVFPHLCTVFFLHLLLLQKPFGFKIKKIYIYNLFKECRSGFYLASKLSLVFSWSTDSVIASRGKTCFSNFCTLSKYFPSNPFLILQEIQNSSIVWAMHVIWCALLAAG